MRERFWWVSCKKFTIGVETDGADIVTKAPPIARKFIGQPSKNLGRWARKFGDFQIKEIEGHDSRTAEGAD